MKHRKDALLSTRFIALFGLSKVFFPVGWREYDFGNGGTSHESQKQDVFAELAIDFFGIYDLTGSMVYAQRTIIINNSHPDFPLGHQSRERHRRGEDSLTIVI